MHYTTSHGWLIFYKTFDKPCAAVFHGIWMSANNLDLLLKMIELDVATNNPFRYQKNYLGT